MIGQAIERQQVNEPERAVMIDAAIAAMGERQSSWRPTELHRELGALVPTDTATTATATDIVELLDDLSDQIVATRCVELSKPVPEYVRVRKDGRPITESVLDRALSTQAILTSQASARPRQLCVEK